MYLCALSVMAMIAIWCFSWHTTPYHKWLGNVIVFFRESSSYIHVYLIRPAPDLITKDHFTPIIHTLSFFSWAPLPYFLVFSCLGVSAVPICTYILIYFNKTIEKKWKIFPEIPTSGLSITSTAVSHRWLVMITWKVPDSHFGLVTTPNILLGCNRNESVPIHSQQLRFVALEETKFQSG